jgi:hypothetical protein
VQTGKEWVKVNLDNKSNLDFVFICLWTRSRSARVTSNFEGEKAVNPAPDFLSALPGTAAALYPLRNHV